MAQNELLLIVYHGLINADMGCDGKLTFKFVRLSYDILCNVYRGQDICVCSRCGEGTIISIGIGNHPIVIPCCNDHSIISE